LRQLVLSDESVRSGRVEFEVEEALRLEGSEKRKVLVPIRLDEAIMNSPRSWAVSVRATQISDFSWWKEPDDYRAALNRLLGESKPASRRR